MLAVQCITVGQWNTWRGRSSAQLESPGKSFFGLHHKWLKMLCELKRSPLTDMPHLIIQTAEFWRAGGGEAESCISDHRSMYSWKWCGLHALLSCVLSPILISRGASWRAGRTAVHLAARRLFISSASPLSACLPASTAKQPNAQRQTVRAFRLSRTSPAFIFLVYFLFPTLCYF